MGETPTGVLIERAVAPTDDVRALIGELDADLSAHYPPEQQHGLRLEALFEPHVRFFIARINGMPVGCGGVALLDGFAEVKRMYVRTEARGQGVADAIVARLESEAADGGLSVVRLETGTEQLAAMRFYERLGFQPCRAFEPYASMPPHTIAASVFMEKRLSRFLQEKE